MTDLPDPPDESQSPASPSDQAREVVKRPAMDRLAQFRSSEIHKRHRATAEQWKALAGGSAAEQMRKMLGGSLAEQMKKAMGDSPAEQMQRAMGGTLAEQMRQAEREFRPFNTVQDTIGLLNGVMESPMRRFLDEQAARHHQRLELLRPRWNQTLVGNAFTDSLRAIQSFNSIQRSELLRVQNTLHQQLNSVTGLLESLRPKLPSFTEVSELWLRYPARVKENLVALATAGWYLDPEMAVADIVHFKEDLENDTAEEVTNELALYFRSSLDRIEASLCADHPERAHLIGDAFAAHREGKYSLSIPALFAQADGICFDLTGYKIFANNGIFRFAKRIDPQALERAYLEPLLRAIPITETSRQRQSKIPQLNRHAVMHGESTDFATEENGLKAISFINFVSHVLAMAVSWQQEMAAHPKKNERMAGTH